MAFSQATITDVRAARADADLAVTWTSSAPEGTVFQVYVNRRLAWHGTDRRAELPWPDAVGVATWIDVGAVGDGEDATDFSAALPTPPGSGNRVRLTWRGGTYLGADLEGFHVYQSLAGGTPFGSGGFGAGPFGATVTYAAPAATVLAYAQGLVSDGFGMGGFGLGGFGHAPASYAWTSDPLSGGVWAFGVRPFDHAGNEGPARTALASILAPPRPPAADAQGLRLHYNLDAGFGTGGFGGGGFGTAGLNLNWLPSPG